MHSLQSTQSSLSFPDAIAAGCQNSMGCLVTLRQTSVAVIFHDQSQSYFLFDSHSRSSIGMVDSNGTAVLLQFSSLHDVCLHLKHLYGIPDSEQYCTGLWPQNHAAHCQFDVIPILPSVHIPQIVSEQASSTTERLSRTMGKTKAYGLPVAPAAVQSKNYTAQKMTDKEKHLKQAERMRLYRQTKKNNAGNKRA